MDDGKGHENPNKQEGGSCLLGNLPSNTSHRCPNMRQRAFYCKDERLEIKTLSPVHIQGIQLLVSILHRAQLENILLSSGGEELWGGGAW